MLIKSLAKTAKSLKDPRFTIDYPNEKEQLSDNERYMLRLDMPTCISCGACERVCPNKTITMVDTPTEKGVKKMPQVDIERCLFCGLCQEVCPTKCLTLTKGYDFEAYDKRQFVKRPEELEG